MDFTIYTEIKQQNTEKSLLTPLTSGPHWSVGGASSPPGRARRGARRRSRRRAERPAAAAVGGGAAATARWWGPRARAALGSS